MSLVMVGMDFNVIIPEEVRDRLPVSVGTPLEVSFQDGAIILRPASEAVRQESIRKLLDGFHKPLPPDNEFANMTEEEIMELAIHEIAKMRAESQPENGETSEAGH